MEVEQVSFYGEGIGAEGRAVADVRNRIKAFLSHTCAGYINSILGHQFLVTRQVNSGRCVLGAVAASTAGGGKNAERTCQQMTGATDAAFADQFADVGAGN